MLVFAEWKAKLELKLFFMEFRDFSRYRLNDQFQSIGTLFRPLIDKVQGIIGSKKYPYVGIKTYHTQNIDSQADAKTFCYF